MLYKISNIKKKRTQQPFGNLRKVTYSPKIHQKLTGDRPSEKKKFLWRHDYNVYLNRFYFHKITLFLGYSDPFVKVRLLPRDKFQHVNKPTTAVHKKTLYPLFDECFKMLVPTCWVFQFVITGDENDRMILVIDVFI